MKDKDTDIQDLRNRVEKFVAERDWEKFHSPKNLSMSLAIEAAELMEQFQWLTIEESHEVIRDRKKREAIEEEIADVAIHIINLCNVLDLDLSKAIVGKLKKNAKKYPVKLAKGKAHKYTYYLKRK